MSGTQNFPDENFSEPINFGRGELKYFVAEIKEMIDKGEFIDIPKAIHNAKYFAGVAENIAAIESGHWTEHELIEG